MNSAEFEHLSIEGIGQMAGFSSRSSFYSAFQAEIGCSPGEYLEKREELGAKSEEMSSGND
jgi:AraC-like DNA-binding protein